MGEPVAQRRRGAAVPTTLPKGFSPETAEVVLAALPEHDELCSSQAADLLGLSRVTARRYRGT